MQYNQKMRLVLLTFISLVAAQTAMAQSYGDNYKQDLQAPSRLHSIDGEPVETPNKPASQATTRKTYTPGAAQTNTAAPKATSSSAQNTTEYEVTNENMTTAEKDCAIWICLPGGFPSDCSAVHDRFKWRIRNHKPPLPDYAGCVGDGAIDGEGRYIVGYDIFEECKPGYELVVTDNRTDKVLTEEQILGSLFIGREKGNDYLQAECRNTDPSCERPIGASPTLFNATNPKACKDYEPNRLERMKRFIQVIVNDEEYPKYYY